MVMIGLGVLLAGLPLGVTGDFLEASFRNSELLGEFPAYKLITMRAFLGAFADSTTLWMVGTRGAGCLRYLHMAARLSSTHPTPTRSCCADNHRG